MFLTSVFTGVKHRKKTWGQNSDNKQRWALLFYNIVTGNAVSLNANFIILTIFNVQM